jgi:hypothetical protein
MMIFMLNQFDIRQNINIFMYIDESVPTSHAIMRFTFPNLSKLRHLSGVSHIDEKMSHVI